ncbi:NPC intracellular cholesterol transporter 2 homolog a [Drosophila elegans]|uniref:NPC intracellular cholesterol transporter 2 homolog a n=1 Tax=Drosophila elegans TaxID=30023 RepID=UPI0007E8A19F|nr:NPC intracellular cholesterol transporter 2 homolog a [Drosophila elegans]
MKVVSLILISLGLLSLVGAQKKHPATEVKRCSGSKPFPLEVRVHGCVTPPCQIVKGSTQDFEIDFVVRKYITKLTTLVKATTLGIITVPYELPADVAAVCPNLQYGAYCPLYDTEDVSYLFSFPIGEYPEIGVKIEIYLVDQDGDTAVCFVCDIKVVKGNGGNSVYELDYLN